ncbi:MAG TPA: hypothetical protein PLQ82_07255 [Desulfobacteraceae bacterium]|nr:hypothetical protein [Desulfobacteraceae bacterium]
MRLKKQKKKKGTICSSLSSSEQAIVSSALQDLQDKDPSQILSIISEPRLAQRFIEGLPLNNESSIPFLLEFHKAFTDKSTRKAVSRAIFKLKRRGVPVDEYFDREDNVTSILLKSREKKAAAYIGPYVLGKGTRPVLIIKDRTGPGQDIAVGLVSDEEGFMEFSYDTYSRKDVKEVKKDLVRKSGVLIETSVSHAATIFEEAYRCHLDLDSAPPVEYLELRPWLLENASPLERPIIYDLIAEYVVNYDLPTSSMLIKLFEHKLMNSWVIDPEILRPYIDEILKIDESPIILSDNQKMERIYHIKDKASDELFSGSKCGLWKYRFEEIAFIFFKLKENDYFQICLAAANAMGKQGNILQKNPVIEFILERSIAFYMKMDQEAGEDEGQESDSGSGILLS